MDSWQALTPLLSKSYNKYGRIALAVIFLLAAMLIAVGYDLKEKENFSCNPNKTIAADLNAKNFVKTNCYMSYEKKHHRSVPVTRFVGINFGLMLVISIAYVGIVNSKVEKFDTKSGENIEEQESWEEESSREAQIFVFPLYILHLILGRVFPIVLYILLIHPANFPVEFRCEWPSETRDNRTTVECVNPLGEKFQSLATSVLVIDCIIVTIAMVEVAYLLRQFYRDSDFASDVEFCSMYLLEKRDLTIRQILKRVRKTINADEEFLNLNSGVGQNGRVLGDLHFRFLVRDGMESKYSQRHEIYNVYLKQDKASGKLRLVNLFPLDKVQIVVVYNAATDTTTNTIINNTGASENTNNTEILELCGKILLIGRAGIGKTLLTKAILYRWAKHKFLEGKVIILLRFQDFRKNKRTTLKKMLRNGQGIASGSTFEELYKFILVNPKKIVLIFDGLDDIEIDCESCFSEQEEDMMNDHKETMSMFAIYIKLLKEKFLPGASIMTTSRPSRKTEKICNLFKIQFQTRLELLGLSEREIEGYVGRFCQSRADTSAQIWRTIENNPEFLSLCYIPAVCNLVCLTLEECFDIAKTDNDRASLIPKTVTELYQRIFRVILKRKLGSKHVLFRRRGYLTASLPQSPEDFIKTLKRLAKSNMESMEVSFQLEAQDISQRIISCGLLTSLPEEYYCFLHVTMQEFLAACHIVDEMKDVCDVRLFFTSLSDYVDTPGWHLVVQFVAGLLGEKVRKKEIDMPKESICRSFIQWIRPLTASNADKPARKAALLVIKCLHEMQDHDIMKLCASEVNGGRNNVCNLSGLGIAPVDCMALSQFLIYFKNLAKLDLSNNQILDLGCLGVVKLLNENVNLTTLNLTRISLSDKGIKIICENLTHRNRRLTHLILEINEITADGLESLCNAITSKKLNLTYLTLRSNKIMVKGAEILGTALTNDNCRITRLSLSGNSIENEGVAFLCNALQHENCKLDDLCLSGNNITYDGIKSLCDVLVATCHLTKLDLQRNKLTARDIEPLRDAIKNKHFTITNLNLSANKLTDAGAECLYHGLTEENSCGLTRLSLANNEIRDGGVKFLCDALKNENCKLMYLDLSANEIGNLGVEHLCDALKNENCRITQLSLMSNNMKREDIERLRGSFNLAGRKNRTRGKIFSIMH